MGPIQLLRTPRRCALLVLVSALTLTLLATCARAYDHESESTVVAVVGDIPITAATVAALLPDSADHGSPVLTASHTPPDPRRVALGQAIRDELFNREAKARGLRGSIPTGVNSRSARIRALIEQGRTAHGLATDHISDIEARAWYTQRHHLFDGVTAMKITWARIQDEQLAHTLLQRTTGTDQRQFLALVSSSRGRGVVDTGRATLDHDGRGADVFVARAAFALRQEGKIGLVVGEQKGTWWLARVDSVRLERSRWDERFAHRVKTAIAWEREQHRLGQLATSLRRKWPVQIFAERLAAIRKQ